MTRSITGVEFAPSPILPATHPPHCRTKWLDKDRIQVDDFTDHTREIWKRNDNGFGLISTEILEETNGTPDL